MKNFIFILPVDIISEAESFVSALFSETSSCNFVRVNFTLGVAVLPVVNFWLSQFGLALRLNVCLFVLAVVEKTWLTNTVEYLCEELHG